MKKYSVVFLIFFLFFLTNFSWAVNNPVTQNTPTEKNKQLTQKVVRTPLQKFNRGIVNIVTAPIEIAKQVDLSWKESAQQSKSKSFGVFTGFFKGLGYTVGRMGSGLWDVVTFPFKTPDNYESLMKPDFVLDQDNNK